MGFNSGFKGLSECIIAIRYEYYKYRQILKRPNTSIP